MEDQLRQLLPQQPYTVETWAPGFVPQACMNEANYKNINAADLLVYNVTYADCGDPWVVCRHKDAPAESDILTSFGQIPVGMRQYLRNVIAFPVSNADLAYSRGPVTVVFGNWWKVGTLAHEFSHVLDVTALTQYTNPGQPFSDTSGWQTPQDQDTALPSDYANRSWQEDFAESGRVALSDMLVSGGMVSINPNSSQIATQISTYEQYLRSIIFTSTNRCTGKAASTPPVPVGGVAKVNVAMVKLAPDVSLSGEVPEIIVPEEANDFLFAHSLPLNPSN